MHIIQHIVLKNDHDEVALADNFVDTLYAGVEICLSVQCPSIWNLEIRVVSLMTNVKVISDRQNYKFRYVSEFGYLD